MKTLQEIEKAIETLPLPDRLRLYKDMPLLIGREVEDLDWQRLALDNFFRTTPRTIKSMSKFKVGDVVSVEFPFSDLQAQKRRLGLVLISSDVDLVVARVTTHPPRVPSDVVLNHWVEIGLPRASTVRLTKLATIDQRLVHHNIGHLHSEDCRMVAESWQQLMTSIATELRK